MADPETLAALKRAYADTILNTMKEAAARVMVSEKKARGFQQEIVRVKDEALHTLLRLKQMFDSKVKETEMISSKQQQKVEELEAQLGEAEDIVGELRMELRELRDELKKLTKGQTHLQTDHEEDSSRKNSIAAVSVVPEVSSSHERSGAVGSCIPFEQSGLVVANGIHSINRCSSKDKKDRCNHTLPSILTKRREAEGCAQLIHTVDKIMASGDLSSSVEVRDVNDGICLPKVPSCKIVEMLEASGCAYASDSTSSLSNDVREGEDPMVPPNSSQKDSTASVSLKTSPSEQENEKKTVISETEVKKQEKESCENIEVSTSLLCEEAPVLAVDKKRCIKYTFQRKRKKEVLSIPEGDSCLEESRNKKQKTGMTEDCYLETPKTSVTNESSRDSLRVAQVAHQSTRSTNGSAACSILGAERFAAELVNQ